MTLAMGRSAATALVVGPLLFPDLTTPLAPAERAESLAVLVVVVLNAHAPTLPVNRSRRYETAAGRKQRDLSVFDASEPVRAARPVRVVPNMVLHGGTTFSGPVL